MVKKTTFSGLEISIDFIPSGKLTERTENGQFVDLLIKNGDDPQLL